MVHTCDLITCGMHMCRKGQSVWDVVCCMPVNACSIALQENNVICIMHCSRGQSITAFSAAVAHVCLSCASNLLQVVQSHSVVAHYQVDMSTSFSSTRHV